MVCVLLTNSPSCAKKSNYPHRVELFNGQRDFFSVCEADSRKEDPNSLVLLLGWICLVSSDFHPLRFSVCWAVFDISSQLLENFPESETERFETTRHISKCWSLSKLKLQTYLGESLCWKWNMFFNKSLSWENLPNFLHPMFGIIPFWSLWYPYHIYFFLIILISLTHLFLFDHCDIRTTFSLDTFCDLWCMYGIFIHLVAGDPLPRHVISHISHQFWNMKHKT